MRQDYRIGVPEAVAYEETLNTDDIRYGGSGVGSRGRMKTEKVQAHGREYSLSLTLPPLATIILKPVS